MKYWTVIVSLAFLAACGGGGGTSGGGVVVDPGPSVPAHRVLDISVSANGDISPGTPAFTLFYDVDDPDVLYDVTGYISADNSLSNADIEFVFGRCGGLDDECGAQDHPLAIDFDLNNSHELFLSGDPNPVDLSGFLDTIPKDAFIILETCNIGGTQCETVAIDVTFN